MTAINGSAAAVTGERCGLGKELAAQLLSRGATTVGAGARRPHEWGTAVPIPVGADVTYPASVTALAGCFCGAARPSRAPAPTRSLHRTDG
jgi:NAD(P)-dependent dehydrogenase (short-subunit alcohol dehydrogenase family)